MNQRTASMLATIVAIAPLASAGPETENFDGGLFTNPVFSHAFEFPAPMWEIIDPFEPNQFVLHLIPNTDKITFNLNPNQHVDAVRFDFRDHESNFLGNPSSTFLVRGASGDFITGVASQLMTWETFTFFSEEPGKLTGQPIGDIVEIMVQSANAFQGGFIDNISINVVDNCYPDCDTSTGVGTLDIFDFLCFQDSFVNADPYACDCDTTTGPLVCDIFDFLCFQNAFVAGCP
jgi:hypothetical protein